MIDVHLRSLIVSTHSRLKAAGYISKHINSRLPVSTHSRLKAAGEPSGKTLLFKQVSTHSRLKAAGSVNQVCFSYFGRFQHTAA